MSNATSAHTAPLTKREEIAEGTMAFHFAKPYEELNLEQPWEQFNIEHELTRKGIQKFVSDYKSTLRKAS